jgi:hypothetical protein
MQQTRQSCGAWLARSTLEVKKLTSTNLLGLGPDNSIGTNYGVEVWDNKPLRSAADVRTFRNRGRQQEHGCAPPSATPLSRLGPRLRRFRPRRRLVTGAARRKNGKCSPRFTVQGVAAAPPLTIPLPPVLGEESWGRSTGRCHVSPMGRSQGLAVS